MDWYRTAASSKGGNGLYNWPGDTRFEAWKMYGWADEDAYKQVAAKASGTGTHDFEFLIRKASSGNGPEFTEIKSKNNTTAGTASECVALANELHDSLSSIKDPKQTGMTAYKVTIVVKQGFNTNSSIHSTATTTEEVTQIGDIKVQTVKAPTTGTWNK